MNLNLVKNYKHWTNSATEYSQFKKVTEEFNEVIQALNDWKTSETRDKEEHNKNLAIGELFDLITASYNMIYKIELDYGVVDRLFKKHIEKLDKYNIKKYASKAEEKACKDCNFYISVDKKCALGHINNTEKKCKILK